MGEKGQINLPLVVLIILGFLTVGMIIFLISSGTDNLNDLEEASSLEIIEEVIDRGIQQNEEEQDCVDECSSLGIKKCVDLVINTIYRTCGNYDSDSCLEWGDIVSCPDETICQNGECVTNPLIIQNDFECYTPPNCANNSCEKTFCREYYNGVEFDGFCLTDFEKTIFTCHPAENGLLNYSYSGSNVERIVRYPTSIKIGDSGINFKVNITLINKGNSIEKISLSNFKMYVYSMETINFNEEYVLNPGETKDIQILFNFPEIDIRSGVNDVNKYVVFNDGDFAVILPRIIIYPERDPFTANKLSAIKECGGRKYAEHQGVCFDDVFFPAVGGLSCYKDEDCVKYGMLSEFTRCYEYSCLNLPRPGSSVYVGPKNKSYKVGILPVYVTDDDKKYLEMSNVVNDRLNEIIPKMENWFDNEKTFWKVSNDFRFDYFQIKEECRMSHSQLQEIIPPLQKLISTAELRKIEEKCINNNNYDILVVSIQNDNNFPSFSGGGASYGTILSASLSPRTIIHEILHSFGESDLYDVLLYQFGDCYLYNANTGSNWDEEMPHLCSLEAMQLGWGEKYPSG